MPEVLGTFAPRAPVHSFRACLACQAEATAVHSGGTATCCTADRQLGRALVLRRTVSKRIAARPVRASYTWAGDWSTARGEGGGTSTVWAKHRCCYRARRCAGALGERGCTGAILAGTCAVLARQGSVAHAAVQLLAVVERPCAAPVGATDRLVGWTCGARWAKDDVVGTAAVWAVHLIRTTGRRCRSVLAVRKRLCTVATFATDETERAGDKRGTVLFGLAAGAIVATNGGRIIAGVNIALAFGLHSAGAIGADNLARGTGCWRVAIIGIRNALSVITLYAQAGIVTDRCSRACKAFRSTCDTITTEGMASWTQPLGRTVVSAASAPVRAGAPDHPGRACSRRGGCEVVVERLRGARASAPVGFTTPISAAERGGVCACSSSGGEGLLKILGAVKSLEAHDINELSGYTRGVGAFEFGNNDQHVLEFVRCRRCGLLDDVIFVDATAAVVNKGSKQIVHFICTWTLVFDLVVVLIRACDGHDDRFTHHEAGSPDLHHKVLYP